VKRALLVLAAVLAGCEEPVPSLELAQITPAPPASVATVVNDYTSATYAITLSVGVAMAVQCWDDCGDTYDYGRCTHVKLTSGETNQLGVRPLYRVGASEQDDFVLVGSAVGSTSLHVETDCASRDYTVAVVARQP
jgi:hypothetical protein